MIEREREEKREYGGYANAYFGGGGCSGSQWGGWKRIRIEGGAMGHACSTMGHQQPSPTKETVCFLRLIRCPIIVITISIIIIIIS